MLVMLATDSCPAFLPFFFFFNDTATTEIYTLSLHDALPIFLHPRGELRALAQHADVTDHARAAAIHARPARVRTHRVALDRKSTRLNSSHDQISYAVFCLNKKKTTCLIRTSDRQIVAHHSTL